MASQPASSTSHGPFTSGALGTDVAFWRSYIESRPAPSDDFLDRIYAHCREHGGNTNELAHDVGTGPGNIAARLSEAFHKVVASDVNESALAAGPQLLRPKEAAKITFISCAAEELSASNKVQKEAQNGTADLVVVPECIPLLDADRSIRSFADLLKPKGALAVYFYGRPFFVEEPWASKCNELYGEIATRIYQMFWPLKDSPGYPFHARSSEALVSRLDNIALPSDTWTNRQRHKWNSDMPFLFNNEAGYDFTLTPKSRLDAEEEIIEHTDRDFWVTEWDIARVTSYLDSNYPRNREKAGERYAEIQEMLNELEQAMGGEGAVRKISWPLVLLLATKK